jgi:PAS domain S-box-containing protein
MSERKRTRNYLIKIDFYSVQGTLTAAFVLVVLAGFFVALYTHQAWRGVIQQKVATESVIIPVRQYTQALLLEIKQSQVNLSQYLLLNEPDYKKNNRQLWLVTIPTYKDSLYHYVAQSEHEETRVAMLNMNKRINELKQLELEVESIYENNLDKAQLRKLLRYDIANAMQIINQEAKNLIRIQNERLDESQETFLTQKKQIQYIALLLGLVGMAVAYTLSALLMLRVFRKIRVVRKLLKSLRLGHLSIDVPEQRDEYRTLVYEIENLKAAMLSIQTYAEAIGDGRFDTKVLTIDPDSELGRSFAQTETKLQKVYEEDRQQSWITASLAKFSEVLRSNTDSIEELCRNLMQNLVKHLDLMQGGLFLLEQEDEQSRPLAEPYFNLVAAYAYGKDRYLERKVPVYEGLIGRVYQEKQLVYLTTLPEDYMFISSGLGKTQPKALLILPLESEGRIEGVIELAAMKPFASFEIDFLRRLSESAAATIIATITSERNNRLLSEAQQMAQTLRAQERELRKSSLEVLNTQEAIERQLVEADYERTKFKAILDSSISPIIISDERGSIKLFNKAAEQMFGYTQAEVLDKNIAILMPLPYSREHDLYMSRYLQTREAHVMGKGREVEALTKNKQRVKVILNLSEVQLEKEHLFAAMLQPV